MKIDDVFYSVKQRNTSGITATDWLKINDEFLVHDGWQIVLTLDQKGTVKDRNLWGANQDELLATSDATGNESFTLCDHLGSVRDIIDESGKVIEHREYNAFGKIVSRTNDIGCVFGYTGKMFDITTGLQWNINRWYDAELGRWCSEDPIGFKGKDMNLVRYVGNASALFVDYFGFFARKYLYDAYLKNC